MQAGFIQAHVARGSRSTMYVGSFLTLAGMALLVMTNRGHWGFASLFLLPGLASLGVWLGRRMNPRDHPIYRELALYGDVEQMGREVNAEFAGIKPDDGPHFGTHWLAVGDTYGLRLVPWRQVAWLYSEQVVHGKVRSYYVRVFAGNGQCLSVSTGIYREEAERMLRALQERAPWAEVGHSPELAREWREDRAAFLRRVDARRQTAQATQAVRG